MPAILNIEEALVEDDPKIYEDGNLLCNYKAGKGNVEEGFKKADFIFEREYEAQKVEHMPIELEVGVAVPFNDGVTSLLTNK